MQPPFHHRPPRTLAQSVDGVEGPRAGSGIEGTGEPAASETSETTKTSTPLPEILTADEVAKLLRVNRKTVYAAFKKGEIPGGRRLGVVIRFSRDRVLQWMADGQESARRSPRGAR